MPKTACRWCQFKVKNTKSRISNSCMITCIRNSFSLKMFYTQEYLSAAIQFKTHSYIWCTATEQCCIMPSLSFKKRLIIIQDSQSVYKCQWQYKISITAYFENRVFKNMPKAIAKKNKIMPQSASCQESQLNYCHTLELWSRTGI